ncbi:MAG: sulfatase-like hydrolase/transferase [Lentisphaerae bacterium]|nr:sulfatase-like hydrolase/transferase [Lentisphaerota bacterium]
MRTPFILLCGALLLASAGAASAEEAAPSRAILFIVDGLHEDAPDRLGLTNFLALCAQGTRVTKTVLLAPAHPRTGAWAAVHTCSLPNPILLAGTLFLAPGHPMIQDAFPAGRPTLHMTNGRLYESLKRGFSHAEVVPGDDAAAVRAAVARTGAADWSLLCVHLQDTGKAGYRCGRTRKEMPGRRDIWAEGSPYVAAAREADRLLGELMQALRDRGQLDSTLIVVTADHGQASTGGHPTLSPEGWVVPLVFAGPGIARGRALAQAEQIDIVPTICALMNVPPPNSGPAAGRVIAGVRAGSEIPPAGADPMTMRIDTSIREFRLLAAQALALTPSQPQTALWIEEAEAAFYGPDRILDWPKLGSPEAILQANQAAIDDLKTILSGETPRLPENAKPGAPSGGS